MEILLESSCVIQMSVIELVIAQILTKCDSYMQSCKASNICVEIDVIM